MQGHTSFNLATLKRMLFARAFFVNMGKRTSKKTGNDMTIASAILLLVLGNFTATVSDVLIKLAGQDIPIFQFIFIRSIFTSLFLLIFYRSINWSNLFVGLPVHFLRGNIWVLASLCLVLSLQLLPLSTANAIFYTVPIMIVLLSVLFLKERLTALMLCAVIGGFTGVLVILRPTEINLGAIYALIFSLLLAVSSLLIRKLPKRQALLHGLWVTQLCAIPLSFALFVWEGTTLNLAMMGYAVGSSLCSIGYSFCCMKAYSHVPASRIASVEYVGLLFVVFAGWLIFSEALDIWFVIGAALIIVPIYLLGRHARKKTLTT
ncbi:DMT family transporter [Marinomonas agarivorans]|nr:DMT family transporter [Marinomonas agarivorans]